MKTHLASRLATLAALLLLPLAGQAENDSTPAPAATAATEHTYRVQSVDGEIRAGTPLIAVQMRLGQPDQRLGTTHWVYRNYVTKGTATALPEDCTWLLLEHDGKRVTALSLTEATIIARLRDASTRPTEAPESIVAQR